ncbi:MAG: hypothetical protein AAF789_14810, partial [Bacteroidota bacterium]
VLEAFPEIYHVKCVNYNLLKKFPTKKRNQIKPGELQVVVVPKVQDKENPIKVDRHLLDNIKAFLNRISSSFVEIKVRYPSFEKIRVNALVKIHSREDPGAMLALLKQDLDSFLCPWVNGHPMPLGETIKVFEIYRFLEQQDYVKYITQFSVVHLYEDQVDQYQIEDSVARSGKKMDVIQSRNPWSTIIPLPIQGLELYFDDDAQAPVKHSLERMYLDNDVIINPPVED